MTVFGHPVLFDCLNKDKALRLRRLCRGFASDKVAVSLRRDDSRIATDLDWHSNAPMDQKVNGNSAFFSAEREVYFCKNPET